MAFYCNHKSITKVYFFILFLIFICTNEPFAKEERLVPVGVTKAVQFSSEKIIELPGTVLAWATTRLAAEIDGRVEKLFFQEGDFVKKGKPLVQLRTRPLQLQIKLAEAEKQMVKSRLEELQAGTRLETIEAAKFAVKQSKARVRLANNELIRIKKLYKDGVLSLDEYDKADAEADSAQSELKEKESVLKELIAGPRIEKIRQEEANYQAAIARIKIIEDDIKRATIHAPFNGYIIKKETEVGQWLEKGDPAVLMNTDLPLKIEINVPQFQFNSIPMGAQVNIFLDTYNKNIPSKSYKGIVIEKIKSGNTVSRTFPLRIKVEGQAIGLSPGMLVQVQILAAQKTGNQIFVPKDALVRTPKDISIWVIRTDNENSFRAHKVLVETGMVKKSLVAIRTLNGSLKPGELVVVQGNERLKPKIKVNIIK